MNSKVIPDFLFNIKKERKIFDLLNNNYNNQLPVIYHKYSCPICYQKIYHAYQLDNCTHLYCKNCIGAWAKIKKQCPLCRKPYRFLIFKD